ncbi:MULTISPECIES: PAS domain-containing sensor histidine kinase [unclassified Rhizobium]|uniref:PAS domain-containing sensor histidine kinase n=1 Tax=unclassified Rhizobium TaxID=2613769 RepID=UPI00161F34DB|nr:MULTISPECIES: PAS domain-containing sensor histidine kinase [unclassified Rhizobium]MBB3290544.1 signal transduction histidine kinase [Rhizobium sp. BK252]MBB3405392.1 signal transduction histidine kinase [Rhizobium sp. BK289]MBB3417939.1 signal transduction histidine kinase [Rhizobium sp. BK284]MBB3485750.1 signal transduction histidine kinase [Rhizobium sp. BK347]MDK4722817.1 ATP-binding protein [Rhizobium sp. CNPSo 3968]
MFEGEDNLHQPALHRVAARLQRGSSYRLSARTKQGKGRLARLSRLLRLSVFGGLIAGLAGPVLAQSNSAAQASMRLFTSSEMAVFSVIIGVISAALLSTMWMVRQRGNMESESREIRTALSDANQRISQYQALIADKNRRIVIWDGPNARPELLGQLPVETGAPQDNEFLAFGRWLKSWSAGELDKAIDKLRGSGQSFDMVVETNRDEILEAQGRISGGRAFVRFIALNNLRAELAELKIERDRLMTSISTFQSLLDAIDLPVWQRDTEGKLTWVNQAYSEAVEAVSAEEALREGREFLTTVARERIRAAATPESPFHDKISTVVHGNRTFFDVVDVRAPNGSAGIAIDVSEAESVRAELARTLKSHAETLDHLATPVAIFDGERRLQFYNQAFVQLWELDIAFLEKRPDNSELLDRLRSAKKLPEQLNWKTWKDDVLSVYRALDTQADLWHLPNGQILRVFATAHPQGGATWVFENLTEQVDLETRYNTLVKVQGETIDHLSEGVAVFGPDGRIRLSNPAFRILWNITEAQAKPGTHIQALAEACAPSYDRTDGWKRFAEQITSFDDERPSSQGTLELYSNLVLDYAVIPLPNAQTMLTFVNKTDSVRAERALTEKNEALLKADELKNDFVQHVSYELRSPLTNIIGFTDLLKTPGIGALNERQAEYIDHISTSSSVLLTLVNDILDLATVDAGIMRLNYSEIVLNDLLDEVSMQIADRLQESGVMLEITVPAHLGSIVADQQRLKQILLKLLTNAANFAPEGSTISLKCGREGMDFVFSVSDRGPGIPEELLHTVFNRFASGGKGGKRSGAGLGLSIVESFVSLHEGEVSIESQAGKGTMVTCRIPSAELPHSVAAE